MLDKMSDFIVEASTHNSAVLKTLAEAIKAILMEVNMVFDEDGMKMVAVNSAQTLLFHLRLNADKFQLYNCSRRFTIGFDTEKYQRIMKTLGDGDVLTYQVDKNDQNKLILFIENKKNFTFTRFKLNTLDIDEKKVDIPTAHFNSVITLPSERFQKIIRDMYTIGKYVQIKSTKDSLSFECKGSYVTQETVIGETANGMTYEHRPENDADVVQAVYNLEHLALITKCTSLCDTVTLYLRNDFPLMIKYNVGSMGEVKFCLHKTENQV